jgi:TPR repeat protein
LATAQHNLAIAYQSGRGVSKDTAMALFWMLIAARAADAAERLVPLLSESEKADMVPRAEAWQAKTEEQTSPADSPETAPYMTLSIDDVKLIQRRLKALGYDPGLIDGIAGNASQQAIAGFYKGRGMEWRHGPLSHRLLKILN